MGDAAATAAHCSFDGRLSPGNIIRAPRAECSQEPPLMFYYLRYASSGRSAWNGIVFMEGDQDHTASSCDPHSPRLFGAGSWIWTILGGTGTRFSCDTDILASHAFRIDHHTISQYADVGKEKGIDSRSPPLTLLPLILNSPEHSLAPLRRIQFLLTHAHRDLAACIRP